MRYIEMHCGPAAYVLGPPPSRCGDLELEGGVNAGGCDNHASAKRLCTSHMTFNKFRTLIIAFQSTITA